ncbi:MAG: LamG-like jellyroll fold domain-containing protein, partial [Ignavibacteria bacterium]|nr:LamG-like jellyroll fold domain-containing protein [Ignavibacteria bacterium]
MFGIPDTPANIQFWMYGDDHYYDWTNDGNWHHVAFTFNSSNQLGTLYLDGTSVASATFGGNMTGSGKARLCASTWATDGYFTGELDEVRIWNSVRTATEISDNKNNLSLSPSTSGLVAYYHFDQGTAGGSNSGVTTLTDATSNTYNGTLTNFALSGSTSNWVSSNNSALPVELTSFSANMIDSKVFLNWQTANEVNNYGFNVERSVILSEAKNLNADGGTSATLSASWKTLGFVQGHGNSNSPKNYSFEVASPLSGIVQYRLKQIDFDGKYEYSDVVEVNVDSHANFALNQNHPNPFNPETTISYKVQAASQVNLKVFDVLGREVVTLVDEYKQPGNYIATFNTRHLERSREIP